MSGTSASEGFPIYGNKRELVKTKAEWINLVLTALGSKYTGQKYNWGCLSEDGLLFQISKLAYTRIPSWVINHLVNEGTIWLKSDGMGKGYYECAKPSRKRIQFEEKPEEIIETEIIANAMPVASSTGRSSIMAMLRKPKEVKTTRRLSFKE